MAKNRNKKKKNGDTSMDITSEDKVTNAPQDMDTSETVVANKSHSDSLIRKVKKGVQMKRTKSAHKMKAIAKAVSKNEKAENKTLKKESKKLRTQSAKKLYD